MTTQCNWKKTAVVPTSKEMIDIVLSKTQRKTPTVIHRQYPITRIREFYMRKVRFSQSCFEEKFNRIVQEFPRIDDVHPFYSDLLNVLYDRDHYKIALSQINLAKTLIDHVARDYTRLLKYADSLFRCKQLKRAALGRMCTLVKRQTATLTYLEQVRQHLARLPTIDPTTRTVLIAGYPNVGKSSLLNRLTRADVQVDAYAFTTKSLYVGHAEHRYVPFQLVDTPGILDHPLDERNTIEMQSVTALAHLRALILFVVDISELCGYPLEQQLALFRSIQPLFINKPVIIVLNKVDVRSLDQLGETQRASLDAFVKEFNVTMLTSEQVAQLDLDAENNEEQAVVDTKAIFPANAHSELLRNTLMMTMSTLTGVGVMEVKRVACDKLLQFRVEHKARGVKQRDTLLGRLYVSVPQPRDKVTRPACIPDAARKKMLDRASTSASAGTQLEEDDDDEDTNRMLVDSDDENQEGGAAGAGRRKLDKVMKKKRKTERDLELELGDDYHLDLRKHWIVEDDSWRYDVLPELVDGHNVADFIDPEIDQRLEELEREEQLLEQSGFYGRADEEEDEDEETTTRRKHVASLAKQIREKKQLRVLEHRSKKIRNSSRLPRNAGAHKIRMGQVESTMGELGVSVRASRRRRDSEPDNGIGLQHMSRERERGLKRKRSESIQRGRSRSQGERMETDGDEAFKVSKRPKRDVSAHAVGLRERDSSMRPAQQKEAKRAQRTVQKRVLALGNRTRAGEADRRIFSNMPKHLFAGKRSNGKTDRR